MFYCFCRITLDGTRKQFSTGHFLTELNNHAQRYKGSSKDAQPINSNLDLIKQKLQKSYDDIVREKEIFYIDDIYNRFSGTDKE